MSKAAEFLESLAQGGFAGDDERPADLPASELRAETIRRLANPKAAGFPLATAWRALRDARPGEDEAKLWAIVSDTSQPRVVRARFAEALHSVDADRWGELAADLPDDDDLLAFEGYLELELTLHASGLRKPEDLAELLSQVPDDERADAAIVIERLRASTGPLASELYGAVLGEGELGAAWPPFAAAVATEGSPEALALLDLALLARPAPAEAEAVRAARARLVASRPPATRRAGTRGEAYFDDLSPYGVMSGHFALAKGRSRTHFMFDFSDGKPADIRSGGTLPVDVHRSLVQNVFLADGGVEVPWDEALGLVAEAVRSGGGVKGGTSRELAPLRDAFQRAPPLVPVAAGKPFDDDELRALLESGAMQDWTAAGRRPERLATDATPAQLARHVLKAERMESLARRVERQTHWLIWHGDAATAARLSAHRIDSGVPGEPFERFAKMWALLFCGG